MDIDQQAPEVVLQKLYNTLSSSYDFKHSIFHRKNNETNFNSKLFKTNVENVINTELKQIQEIYKSEEHEYVEQMLLEEPPTVNNRRNDSSDSGSRSDSEKSKILDVIKLQKAESCRRSRINNKIKKSKSKFRHQFISDKLVQNTAILKCINDVIQHAELKFITSGTIDETTIKRLRRSVGMDGGGRNKKSDNVEFKTKYEPM